MDLQSSIKTAIREVRRGGELMVCLRSHIDRHTQASELSDGVLQALEASLAFLESEDAGDRELGSVSGATAACSPTRKQGRSSKKRRHNKIHVSSVPKRRSTLSNSRTIFTPAPHHDGHQWRKYGQKMIQKSKYLRNYYRCTHRHDQGCLATKLVQQQEGRADEESPTFQVVYVNSHTCNPISYLAEAQQIIFDTPRDESSFFTFETKNSCSKSYNFSVGNQEQLVSLSPQCAKARGETKADSTCPINDFSFSPSWDIDSCGFDFEDVDIHTLLGN